VPDSLQRYFLSEIEDRIRRLLNQVQAQVNTTTGAETNPVIQSQAFSNTDIDQEVNRSLIALYTEIVLDREDQFSQTYYVSVGANNPGPYAFPPSMLQLRYMDWIDPGVGQASARPEQWSPMNFMDDPMDRQMTRDFRGPTWQYDLSGSAFILNQNPNVANPSGVRIKCVVLPPELVNPTDVIVARFARVMQQAVIYDASQVLAQTRLRGTVSQEIAEGRQEWHQRLVTTAENAHKPPSTVSVSPRMPQMNYSGRRRGRRGW